MGEGEWLQGAPQVGVILLGRLLQVRLPSSINVGGEGKRGGEKERGRPNSPLLFSLTLLPSPPISAYMGEHQPARGWSVPLLAHKAHKAHIFAGGCLEPLPVTRYVPGTPGTLPVYEYYRPIYESLPLDHFETPRHVRDLIQDSEQHFVTKSHNSYNTKSSSNIKRADPTGSRTM